MAKKRITSVFLIILSVLWFFVICGFSGENSSASDETSSRVTELVLSVFIRGFSDLGESEKADLIAKYNHPVRKLAHFTEYAVLGALLSIVFLCFVQTKKRFYLFSVTLSFILASTDEIHQLFVSGRACRFYDVLIDTSGAAAGILLVLIFTLLFKKKKAL